MTDYVKWIRSKVGNERIFLNVVGGWVENSQGKVLLQKRSPNEELWGFPGGVMNLGESAEETAIREIKEETGFDVATEELIGVYTKFFATYSNGDQVQLIVFFFKMKIIGGNYKIDNIETFDIKFFSIEDIPPLFSELHQLMLIDAKNANRGVYR